MKEYIDKSEVKAEIERRISLYKAEKSKENASKVDKISLGARMAMLEEIISFLNTLEVKEVDLVKEFDKCCENYIFDDECEVYTARHFFELGLKAQKGE